jgi:non-canonical (house-cleaning) NTP pyrophosphatase
MQIHHYDQAHARRTKELDNLIAATRQALRDKKHEIAVAGVAMYLRDEMSPSAVAEILACALERFAGASDK